jgi:hypothetical protein
MPRMRWEASGLDSRRLQGDQRARGRRGSQIMRMRRKGAEFEGLVLLRTFVSDPATAQWATVGEAPAPQLNDRSPPRPQRGNGREQ